MSSEPIASAWTQPAAPREPATLGPAWILSAEPPLFLTGLRNEDLLGIARAYGERYGNLDAAFILFPTWSLEREGFPESVKAAHDRHLLRFPRHRFRYMCNTHREAELLGSQGLPALFLNKNFTVSEAVFRPDLATEVEFDAIYNARFIPEKRHELAALIPKVAYITYVESDHAHAAYVAIRDAIALRNPEHVLLNVIGDGRPIWMSHERINTQMARASVGLVLSEMEGANYASMEYMLAGLPVVSTPSAGGRDVYFDPDYCLVCEPTPEAVRDAVAELKGRKLSRDEVRRRTLEKIKRPRERFLDLIDEVLGELGASPLYAGKDWPFRALSGVRWALYSEHLESFIEARRSGIAAKLGLDPALLSGVQLEAQEIGAIADAIRSRPGCRLLVFGCGNDSAFWEALNADGETAFIEDDPTWAKLAAERLSVSSVHLVAYETQLAQWGGLLDMPQALSLNLPLGLTIQKWDVIIVDGPAGYDPFSSGRMKSIFAAARLVAPGGAVFVHDTEREVEAAYASRYLGDERLFVEVRGHAQLKGYAF